MAGEILKQRREELGQNLREIAHILRIRFDYLKAVEDDAFEKLPVEVYAKGYIREYARFLNLDPEPVIKAYIEKISPSPAEKAFPATPPEKREKTFLAPLAIAVLLFAVAAIYFLYSSTFLREKQKLPEERIVKTQPVQPAPAQAVKPEEIPKKEVGKKEVPKQEAEKQAAEKVVEEHMLQIAATETTWILLKADDAESKEMLLQPGESLKYSAKERFSLKIGNAGGVKLVIDGKDIGTPGEKGQVMTLNLPAGNKENPVQ